MHNGSLTKRDHSRVGNDRCCISWLFWLIMILTWPFRWKTFYNQVNHLLLDCYVFTFGLYLDLQTLVYLYLWCSDSLVFSIITAHQQEDNIWLLCWAFQPLPSLSMRMCEMRRMRCIACKEYGLPGRQSVWNGGRRATEDDVRHRQHGSSMPTDKNPLSLRLFCKTWTWRLGRMPCLPFMTRVMAQFPAKTMLRGHQSKSIIVQLVHFKSFTRNILRMVKFEADILLVFCSRYCCGDRYVLIDDFQWEITAMFQRPANSLSIMFCVCEASRAEVDHFSFPQYSCNGFVGCPRILLIPWFLCIADAGVLQLLQGEFYCTSADWATREML